MAFTAMTGCSDSKETGAPAETSGGDTRTLVGTIEDIANATIAVRDEEGETYIFERDDSLVVSTDGLMLIGEVCRVMLADVPLLHHRRKGGLRRPQPPAVVEMLCMAGWEYVHDVA